MNRTSVLVVTLLCSLCCAAYDLEVDGIYYNYNAETQEAYVTSGEVEYKGQVVIPAEVGRGVPVTGIGDKAFAYCGALSEVSLPNSITTIGDEAFRYCSALKAISLPESVVRIGQSAFEECRSLTRAEFASTERLFLISYGNETANPLSVAHHFYVAGKEEEVTELFVPESVTSIRNAFFRNWTALRSIVFNDNLTDIGEYAFQGCTGIKSVTLPQNVNIIGLGAFYGCTGMTEVRFLCENAIIEYFAFQDCTALTKADFTSIEALCSLQFLSESSNPLLYAHHLYIAGEEVTKLSIPQNVMQILFPTFCGCSYLTSITLPPGLTYITDSAFKGCSSLTSIQIPDNVTHIGTAAFSGCSGLTSIQLPDKVTTLNNNTFNGCTGLNELALGNVERIGIHAFYGCSALTSLRIPESVFSIDKEAFGACTAIEELIIEERGDYLNMVGALPDCKINRLFLGRDTDWQNIATDNIRKMTLSPRVSYISPDMLWNSLDTLYTMSETPEEVTCNFPTKTCLFTLLFVPMGTKEKYRATEGWNQFFDIREMPVENMWPNGESGSCITQIPERKKRMTEQPLFDINGHRTTIPLSGRLYISQGKKFLKK